MTPTQTPDQTELSLELELYKSEPEVYKAFHERYIWCVACGKPEVQAHHIVFKSQSGKTTLDNLIPLCPECHMRAHGQMVNGQKPIKLESNLLGTISIYDHRDAELLRFDQAPHEPTETDGQIAFDLNTEIKALAQVFQSAGLELGEKLYQMEQQEIFKTLGYETFPEYVAGELPIGPGQAYRVKQIAGQRDRLQIAPESLEGIAIDKLAIVLPSATPESVNEALNLARTTHGIKDLRALVKGEEPEMPDPSKPDLCPSCENECCPKHRRNHV